MCPEEATYISQGIGERNPYRNWSLAAGFTLTLLGINGRTSGATESAFRSKSTKSALTVIFREDARLLRKLKLIHVQLLFIALFSGCSKGTSQTEVKQDDMANLNTIGKAYDEATKSLGRPPKNAEEFKSFLRPYGDPDVFLRSPHDGQPYEIVWGRNIQKMDINSMPPPILAYEKQGVNGMRYVLTKLGAQPMSDADFAKVDPSKKP